MVLNLQHLASSSLVRNQAALEMILIERFWVVL
jgi:hypothetical protein